MRKPNYDNQNYNTKNYSNNDPHISDKELIESRRQEMEEYILPNHQTVLKLSNGNTAIIKSKEVKVNYGKSKF